MIKRKGTFLTLGLAGVMIFSGTGGLCVSMAQTRQENTTTQVEQKASIDYIQEYNDSVTVENQYWQEQESLYLPEGADLAQSDGSYTIDWNDMDIVFWQEDDMARESKEDLGLAKLMPILQDTIQTYSGQDMEKCKMEICLYENFENEYKEFGLSKTFNYDTKYYEVFVSGSQKHEYVICVDSVTGEVLGFDHVDNNLDSFSHGWKMEQEGDVCDLSEKEQQEYDVVIAAFVSDDLKLGKVTKIYGQHWGLKYGESNERAFYTASCKTENGDVVEVTIDCEGKMVNGFSINPIY